MQFTNLMLDGFKSFADRTQVPIHAGVTAIVGPNGCGKSNIVEALRWVMGEVSAKRLRGDDMADVIFGGSQSRGQRQSARVTLSMCTDVEASEFTEVSRGMDRTRGSQYRIDGREALARDVQLLFADNGTGAEASAIIGQGRIANLIASKPIERRQLLEEAAGIRGLEARRHDAELKLRNAQINIGRVDERLDAQQKQFQLLTKQARRAKRYRELSETIQLNDQQLLALLWVRANAQLLEADAQKGELQEKFNQIQTTHSAATSALTKAEAEWLSMHNQHQTVVQNCQELQLQQQKIAGEIQSITQQLESLGQRQRETTENQEYEAGQLSEIARTIADMSTQRDALSGQITQLQDELQGHQQASETAAQKANAQQVLWENAKNGLAVYLGQREAMAQELARVRVARNAAKAQMEQAQHRLSHLQKPEDSIAPQDIAGAQAVLAQGEADYEQAMQNDQSGRGAFGEAQLALADGKADTQRLADGLALKISKLQAECDALSQNLPQDVAARADDFAAHLQIPEGVEDALAAAFGEEISCHENPEDTMFWDATIGANVGQVSLPDGVGSLADAIGNYPKALRARLITIGVVNDWAKGQELHHQLRVGCCLVSRAGDLWRWDGFVRKRDGETPHARQIRLRRRVDVLRDELREAMQEDVDQDTKNQARIGQLQAILQDQKARYDNDIATLQNAKQAHDSARDKLAKLREQNQCSQQALREWQQETNQLEAQYAQAKENLAALQRRETELICACEDETAKQGLQDAVARSHADYEKLQSDHQAQASRMTRIDIQTQEGNRRIQQFDHDIAQWQQRGENAKLRVDALGGRLDGLGQQQQQLQDKPAILQAHLNETMDKAQIQQVQLQDIAEKLESLAHLRTLAQADARKAQTGLREAEQQLQDAKYRLQACQSDGQQVVVRIQDRFHISAVALFRALDYSPDDAWPFAEQAQLEALSGQLHNQREAIGPVNLLAESECEELGAELANIQAEREDLSQAILQLHSAIKEINDQAREKLLRAFNEIDQHFQEIFTTLFGGGKAQLHLSDQDDPLRSGLEIVASPLGKTLKSLSLLSGGEQTLTALALVFAVFKANPAPICVLDEVDAPLDDNNVRVYCDLVDQMAANSNTRFLVITHHRLTMARASRLFGITMARAGISQLVAVDLQKAQQYAA